MAIQIKNDLLQIFHKGLERVKGRQAVRQYLDKHRLESPSICLVAVGKAAGSMALGALDVLGERVQNGILITKRDHLEAGLAAHPQVQCIESDHPVPSAASLAAGQSLIDYVSDNASSNTQFLFLLSGGASSLVEVLAEGMSFAQLQKLTQLLLSHGYDIGQMNRVRRSISKIKGGKLAHYLNGTPSLVLLISDVPGDDPAVIGSGLLTRVDEALDPSTYHSEIQAILSTVQQPDIPSKGCFDSIESHIIACLDDAKQACFEEAQALGYRARIVEDFVEGDATAAAQRITAEIAQSHDEIYIYGGETSLILPDNPGQGGRSQHLALCTALQITSQPGMYLLAAGTDGTDGPTDAAGALVDSETILRGDTLSKDASQYLAAANSYEFLKATTDLIITGPTGTNVMDLIIGINLSASEL